MPESWPPPSSVKDGDEVSTTAGDYHNMPSIENASTEQDQDLLPGASLTAPSHPPSTEPQTATGAPPATAAQGTQNIGTNPPMTIPLTLGPSPNGHPESGHPTLLNGAGLSQASLSTLPPSPLTMLFQASNTLELPSVDVTDPVIPQHPTSSTPHSDFSPSLTATFSTSFPYTNTALDGHGDDYFGDNEDDVSESEDDTSSEEEDTDSSGDEDDDPPSLDAAVPLAVSQLPTPLPQYAVNAAQLVANLIHYLNHANVPMPLLGSPQEDMADENAATMPSVPTTGYIEDLSIETAHETSSSDTSAGTESPTDFLDYVLSISMASASTAARLQRPRFDPVAFLDGLKRVNISDIPAEDMRCAHCWFAFGTTYEDEPGFVFTPDSDDPPELGARQVAFRELPFCAGRPDNDPVQTPCGHLFGRGCLIEIVEKMGTLCPTCRQEMNS